MALASHTHSLPNEVLVKPIGSQLWVVFWQHVVNNMTQIMNLRPELEEAAFVVVLQ